MTNYVAVSATGGTFFSLVDADTLSVPVGVTLTTTQGVPSVLLSGGTRTTVAGTISTNNAAFVSTDPGGSSEVHLLPGGRVTQTAGGVAPATTSVINLHNAHASLVNEGEIFAADITTTVNSAVVLSSSTNLLRNTGFIGFVGQTSGPIGIGVETSGATNIENAGRIYGSSIALSGGRYTQAIDARGGTSLDLTNSGLLGGDLISSPGPDRIVNTGSIFGTVALGAGNDVFDTSGGSVQPARGTPFIAGGPGDDRITGGAGADTIYGRDASDGPAGDPDDGADQLSGGGGVDSITGGYGTDVLHGNEGNDVLCGNQNSDVIFGDQGDDKIWGGKNNDTLYGNDDNDTLNGNLGDDVLNGGSGFDIFVFTPDFAHDVIEDFKPEDDTLMFRPGTFSDYATLLSHLSQEGADAVIRLSDTDFITMVGVDASTLTINDFIFG